VSNLILTPAARPRRPFPIAVAIAAPLLLGLSAALPDQFSGWAITLGVGGAIALCGLGTWLEDRFYTWATRFSSSGRLLAGALAPVAAWVAFVPVVLAGVTVAAMFGGGSLTGAVVLATFAAAVWTSSAAAGSLLVLVLDPRRAFSVAVKPAGRRDFQTKSTK
jgi:hypothetical protein